MDIATFLGRFPPFDSLSPKRLARVAGSVQIEHFPEGTLILQQSGEPSRFLYVVRKGAVEILDDGRLLDLMGEGEAFGTWSLLAGISPTASVRAHEDTLCYLIEPDVAEEVLGTSSGLAYIVASLRRRIRRVEESREGMDADGRYKPVGSLIRRPPVTCSPDRTVAQAAAIMAEERVSSLLVPKEGGWGILTDRDLRTRVVAPKRSPDAVIAEVMSYPARTVSADTMAGEVLLSMLADGFHHFPVVAEDGRLMGVVTDTDLMGLGRHSPFALKAAIERGRDRDAVVAAARELPQVVGTLVDSSADPVDVGHIVGVTIDTLTRRLIELATDRLGEPPAPWAWLALGSAARQEQALHTDQDHALAYDPQGLAEDEIDPYFADLTAFVTDGLEAAGIPRCAGDAMASHRALRRSVDGWVEAYHRWMSDAGGIEGSILMSVIFDFRRVAGPLAAEIPLDGVIRSAPSHQLFIRHLSRRALDERPPTGFFRDFVVEAKGDHVGKLDIKHGGITIIANLARAYAVGAGLTEKRTLGRLRAAAAEGVISETTREALEEAFRFLWGIRLEHQVEQARAGLPPDDFIDPGSLGPVTRRGLKEAFRVIAQAQRRLGDAISLAMP